MDKTGIKDIPEPDIGHIQIGGKFTSISVVDSNSAIAVAQEVAKNSGLENAANELSVVNINAVDEVTYYRLQQNYKGIPVYGRTFIISADGSGNAQSLISNSIDIGDVDTSKTLLLEEAKTIIKNYLDTSLKASNGSTIVYNGYSEIIYTFADVSPAFAYKFNAMVENELYDVFLDIEKKSVIDCIAVNMSQTVIGTGFDVDENSTSFNVNKKSDTSYTLEDFNRNIRVFDAGNKTVTIDVDGIYIVDSKGNTYKSNVNRTNWVDKDNNIITVENDNQQGNWKVVNGNGNVLDENAYCLVDIYGKNTKLNPVESNAASFTNSKAVTLMKEAQNIYDFFLKEFNRIGFDNNNGSMSLVANNTKGAYSSDIAKSTPAAVLVFGKRNALSTEEIAHEYMHSVERSISGMLYKGESGAIMEAYSDLFGEILEDYDDGILDGNCDWIHHAQKEWGYDQNRNIENPNESDNPSKVGEETRPFLLRPVIAKNEVHHCSTIISHAAYVMTTIQGNNTSLTMNELMNLWYRTLLTLPSNCTFSDLRESMILTATNIGFSTEKINRVSSAFSMAGIENNNYSGKYAADIQVSVFDNEGKMYSEYSIDISGQKNLPLWFTEDYTVSYEGSVEPVSIHLDKGDYTITVTDKNKTSDSYSKTITVCKSTSDKELCDNQLRFATDFGDKQYSSKKEGQFEDPENMSVHDQYVLAYENMTKSGSWSEKFSATVPMTVSGDGQSEQGTMKMQSNTNVKGWKEDDLSNLYLEGDGNISLEGSTAYAWTMNYKNGKLKYQYTAPYAMSAEKEMDPSLFNFGELPEKTMHNAQVKDDQITFTVPGEYMAEVGLNATQMLSELDDLDYGDVAVTAAINKNDWTLKTVHMKFSATMTYMDYPVSADFDITYEFGPAGEFHETDTEEDSQESGSVNLTGHQYEVYENDSVTTWEEAKAFCENLGGHLAIISSQEENDYVYNLMRESGYESAYFGLTDKEEEGNWVCVDGTPAEYLNWNAEEPSNSYSGENYAMFYYKYTDGTWNDGDFDVETQNGGHAFICEFEE